MTPCEIDVKTVASYLAPAIGASRRGMTLDRNAGDEKML
jgi:hypothetical protein